MELYATDLGLARRDGDELAVIAVPHPDLGALLADPDVGLEGAARAPERCRVPSPMALRPILGRAGKVWVVGLNYRDHAAETGAPGTSQRPFVYLCPGSALIGSGEAIVLPELAPTAVDYEGEVAVVIGSTAHRVPAGRGWDHVAGVTACNDVTARDVQGWAMKGKGVDIALSKSFDTFKPLGPGLLTLDELDDRDDIRVQTWVNGELRQDDRTSKMSFGVAELVEYISRFTTLHPGDVISTGSPAGVGFTSGAYLRAGDVVEVAVGSMQHRLTNPVHGAAESDR